MNLRTALAAAAVLAVSTPALAQETPAQPPAEAVAATPAQQAFMERDVAFRQDMQAMMTELQVALNDPATTVEQKSAAVDRIIAGRTPGINAFADALEAFLNAERALASDPEELAAIDEALANGPPNVRSIPTLLRAQIDQAIAAAQAEAAGAAPAQPGAGAVAGEVPVQ